jgi:hypothetical protein
MEIYCTAGQATDDNTAQAHCMLDTYGYKHTLRICNTSCLSTGTMVARTRLYVTLHRVSIKSFPDYKHLLQENYMEYKYMYF